MPEGPEVEHVLNFLKRFEGKTIEKIQLTEASQKYPKYKGRQEEYSVFSNQTLTGIERHGKFLVWTFSNKESILNHLGMSGMWILANENTDLSEIKHAKVVINFKKMEPFVVFDDARNFGQFRIFPSYETILKYPPIKRLGLDGLALPFPFVKFYEALKEKRNLNKQIGIVLMDQSVVAGIGNIYKSESLFLAKINPLRKTGSLTRKEIETLGKAISETLQKAVQSMGSTIHSYRNPLGEEGSAQKWHKVYGLVGRKCEECDTKIRRIKQDNRSTFFCEVCQL
jgi:formamidopyrimidine-DNA glycosylase